MSAWRRTAGRSFSTPADSASEDAAVGADAILVTHEHPDHFDEERLRAALEADPAAEIWTLRSVAEKISAAFPGRVHTVGHGDTFTAAGFDVQVHGELHAVIHPDIPRITNVGYLVDGGKVFHPGDALTVPDHAVETLMLPVMAPWSKISEVIDYVREVRAAARLRHPRRPAHRPRPPDLRQPDRRPRRHRTPAAGPRRLDGGVTIQAARTAHSTGAGRVVRPAR